MGTIHKLDNKKTYTMYDKEDINYGIENLPRQFSIAWDGASAITFPASYKKVERIVIVGMGGSNLATEMIKAASYKTMKIPMELIRDYNVPGYVNAKTLVILSSFSGSTEEVLAAGKEAQKKKAKILTISAGGKLAAFARRHKVPHYIFDPGNYAIQPRLGLGFSFAGIAAMLKTLGLLKISKADIHRMMSAMGEVIETCSIDLPLKDNPAKTVATELKGRAILLIGAEHLSANVHIMQNQINETAKQHCAYLTLPELNHHFLEGLSFPKGLFGKFTVILLRSNYYNKRTQKRFDLTADLLEKQGGQVIDYLARGKNIFEEQAEILQFSSYTSYYLAMMNSVKPEEIPFVKAFKEKMK